MACNSKQKLLEDIECEGFHYTFHGYDDYIDFLNAYPNPMTVDLSKVDVSTKCKNCNCETGCNSNAN